MPKIPEEITDESTKILYKDLLAHGASDRILLRCRKNLYHDFKSPYDFPDMKLLDDLQLHGPRELIPFHRDGKYDATKQESDEWGRSEEGQAAFAQLLGNVDE